MRQAPGSYNCYYVKLPLSMVSRWSDLMQLIPTPAHRICIKKTSQKAVKRKACLTSLFVFLYNSFLQNEKQAILKTWDYQPHHQPLNPIFLKRFRAFLNYCKLCFCGTKKKTREFYWNSKRETYVLKLDEKEVGLCGWFSSSFKMKPYGVTQKLPSALAEVSYLT